MLTTSQPSADAGRGKLSDEMLGALADALDSWDVRQVQGFHYPPKFVIRDLMRKPGNQKVWEGPDNDEPTFVRQCEIERLRVAVGLALSKAAAGREALSQEKALTPAADPGDAADAGR